MPNRTPSVADLTNEILTTFGEIGLSRGEVRRFLSAAYTAPEDTLNAVITALTDKGFFTNQKQRPSVREAMLREAERCLSEGQKVPGMRELTRRAGAKSSAAPYSHFADRFAFLEALSKRVSFTWRDIEL